MLIPLVVTSVTFVVLGMLLPILCVVFFLSYGPFYEQGSSSIFVRDDGEPPSR